MKVVVSSDSGELFAFSTDSDLHGAYPSPQEKPAVLAVLADAVKYLNTTEGTSTTPQPLPG